LQPASQFVPNGMGTALPAMSDRRGVGKLNFDSTRTRFPHDIRSGELPGRLLSIPADQDGSDIRPAWLMSVPDFLRVCASGHLRGVLRSITAIAFQRDVV
jgi:hypothetical protein